jgi:hypothetical protein
MDNIIHASLYTALQHSGAKERKIERLRNSFITIMDSTMGRFVSDILKKRGMNIIPYLLMDEIFHLVAFNSSRIEESSKGKMLSIK